MKIVVSRKFFNIKDTLTCGQVFAYKNDRENEWELYETNNLIKLSYEGENVVIKTASPKRHKEYFNIDIDYSSISEKILDSKKLPKKAEEFFITAMKSGQGIRMLKQNFLEMTISFIISANNNIPRIRKTLKKITYNHGEKLDGYYAFPTLDRLLKIKEEEFKAYGAGYRARYLVATIREIAAQEENPTGYSTAYEERLKKLSTQVARKELMKLQGVGRKVADCILLFGLHRGDVFPTDIWIEKVYNDHFKMTEELDATQISAYFEKLFGEHSGYVQQCFYHYKRNLMI